MIKKEKPALSEYTNGRFKGISYACLDASGSIITAYDGFADKENDIKVDENTIFPACSISKFITALCVMIGSDKGVIDIDKPVNNYLTGWKLLTPEGNESDATVRSLLCHVAGVVDGEDGFYGLRRNDPIVSLIEILEGKSSYNDRSARAEKEQGEEFEYSDAGYCVLQLMLEEITKKPYEDVAKEYIFEPLNLKHTFFASADNVKHYEKNNVMASGYDDDGSLIPGKYPQVPDLAASGLWSTPTELLMIAREFINACKGNSSLLKKESALEMIRPHEKFSWTGLGVFMGGENEIVSQGWGENGQSMLKLNYSTGETAVVMTNQNPGVDQKESGIEALVNESFT